MEEDSWWQGYITPNKREYQGHQKGRNRLETVYSHISLKC